MRTKLRGKFTLLFVTCAVLLAIPAIVLADEIANNVDDSLESAREIVPLDSHGKSASVEIYVNGTTGAGDSDPGCNFDPNATTTEKIAVRVFEQADPNGAVSSVAWDEPGATTSTGGTQNDTIEFTGCGLENSKTVKMTSGNVSPASGTTFDANIDFEVSSNNTGGVFVTNTGRFTVKVAKDVTAPETTIDTGPSGTVNSSSANFTFSSNEANSTFETRLDNGTWVANGTATSKTYNSLSDGSHTFDVRATDPARNVDQSPASRSWTVQTDSTAPVIKFTLNPANADGNNGWYKSNVSLTWSVTDPESAVTKTGCVDQNITTDQQATTYSCSATSAGGSAAQQSVTLKRDATAPTNIQFVGGPDAGGTYAFNSVPNEPTCTADDATSTVDSCVVTGYGNAVGGHTLTATATDKAGNKTTATRTYTVNKATAQVNLSDLNHTYDGTVKAASATTDPANLNVDFAYSQNGSAATPKDAGDYAVVATVNNANYEGNAEGTLSIARANQAISFDALANKTFGDANFNVSATGGNSGNAVTFAADGNCSVSGNTVQITGAGSCTITASQAGNANYNAATPVKQSFAIAKAKATIGLSGLQKTYTGQAQGATVTTTPADLGGVSVTYDGIAQAPTNAGSYAVVASLNNANYEAPNATGTLVIAKAKADVTLSDLTQTYDGTDKAASASTTPSGLNVDFAYSQNGSPATPKNAGTYAVVATVNNANYQGSAGGTLVIEKAQATIKLSDLSKTYTGQAQGATVTTNPDVPNAQLKVTYDGSETRPTNAGSYAVVASLNDANYQAQDATGTLVIAKAKAGVTLSGLSKTYDGSAQGVTVSTTPAGLNVDVTYDGNVQAPTNAGSYAVVATVNNANYEGSASGQLVIDKASQAITFAPLANKSLGAADFNVSATGGASGNLVTFAAAGSCTVSSNNTVSVTGVGSCTITASQAGNTNYDAATPVTQSFNTIYNWSGFRQPVDNGGVFNVVKAGQSIPMKFSLSGNQGLGIIAVGFPKVTAVPCSASAPADAIEEVTTSNSGLSYDASIDQYNYVWKTQSTYAGKCFRFDMKLIDGTTQSALFRFTR